MRWPKDSIEWLHHFCSSESADDIRWQGLKAFPNYSAFYDGCLATAEGKKYVFSWYNLNKNDGELWLTTYYPYNRDPPYKEADAVGLVVTPADLMRGLGWRIFCCQTNPADRSL